MPTLGEHDVATTSYVPFDVFEKEYEEHEEGDRVCGAYHVSGESSVVRACAETDVDGAGVLPGYIDMGHFRARDGAYQAMLAPTPAAQVQADAFVSIEPADPEFIQRFEAEQNRLAPNYRHHRRESLTRMLRTMRNWRGPAMDRMIERGTFDNVFRSNGIVRPPGWTTVEQVRSELEQLLSELETELELEGSYPR
ncbi:MAG: hypothetical protein AAFQ82_17135 [Myxococcota bacterium]